jgi:hypothetical protein
VGGDDPHPLRPRIPLLGIDGNKPEGFQGPSRRVVEGLGGKLGAAGIRGGREGGEVTLVIRVSYFDLKKSAC